MRAARSRALIPAARPSGKGVKRVFQVFKDRKMLWIMPSLLLFVGFMAVVLGYTVYLATRNISLLKPDSMFVGLDNVMDLLKDERAWSSIWKTLKFSVSATVIELLLGLGLALFLNRSFKGRNLVRGLLLIPMIMTPVVAGLIWRVFYDPNNGLINYYLGKLGISPQDWLGSVGSAMFSVVLADVWQWTPFIFLILASSMDSMSQEPIEAANVDGASKLQIFWHVTLPMLKPALAVAFLLRFIDSIKQFDLIYVMTRGGPSLATETANMYAYTQGFNNFNISYAATINFFVTLLIVVVIAAAFAVLNRRRGIQ